MKKVLLALLASSTLAVAAPALAHDHDDDGDRWGRAPSYDTFDQQYRHMWQGIEHGVSDGSYTRAQASYFYRELQDIHRRALWAAQRGDYDPRWTEEQLERLHERMHVAHERGHERLDNDWNGSSYGYRSYQPYSGGAYRPYSDYRR